MRRSACLAWFAALLFPVSVLHAQTPPAARPDASAALPLRGDVEGAHDPSMIRSGNTWYVFTTGKAADGGQLGVRCSDDLTTWRLCGHVFDAVPAWIHQRSPQTKDLWAPDISFEHGQYRLYYSYSVFGKNTSGIALATNATLDPASPEYRWVDRGLVLESVAADDYNAIDPNYVEDAQGRAWLDFGSFWTGIKMRALGAKTGKMLAGDPVVYALAARGHSTDPHAPGLPSDTQAVEAPFVVRHGGYYYLFVSFDLCCRGTRSTYRTMVGRSTQITGPYVDKDNVPMTRGGGSALLVANGRWLGPGGASVVLGTGGAPDLIVHHAYDAVTGRPSLHIATILWRQGWPVATLPQ